MVDCQQYKFHTKSAIEVTAVQTFYTYFEASVRSAFYADLKVDCWTKKSACTKQVLGRVSKKAWPYGMKRESFQDLVIYQPLNIPETEF